MTAGSAAEPVELRIHGVGGASPEGLLGERHPNDAVLVRRGYRTGLWARRRDPSVRGYVWGGLTSGAKLQPLWVLLLPFTVMNVAGWMHPPVTGDERRRRQVRDIRALVTVLAFTLTVTWALWLAIVVGDLVAFQGGRARHALATAPTIWAVVVGAVILAASFGPRHWALLRVLGVAVIGIAAIASLLDHPGVRAVGGVLAAEALMGALVYVAGVSRRHYEQHAPTGVTEAGPRTIRSDEDLRSPTFFARPSEGRRLLWAHVAALAAVTALLCWRAAIRADEDALDFGSWLVAVGLVQLALLVVLGIRSLGEWPLWQRRWRFAGPAAAAGLGVLLTNGVFTGVTMWTARHVAGAHTGAELALADIFVEDVLLVGAILLLAFLPYFLGGKPPPLAAGASADERSWHSGRYRRQQLALAFRHVDLVATAAVAFVAVAGLLATLSRFDPHGSLLPWHWSIDDDGGLGAMRGAAVWLLPFVVPLFGGLIRAGQRSTGTRRNIGNLWDIMGVWPRRFHPFAVRPYAERAIPELQDHVRAVLAEGRPLVVSAHSQGTVLAFIALTSLAVEEDLGRVALVTYGSPLSRLHARFFPAYIGAESLGWLNGQLYSWRSFFHRTDHIGQAVFEELSGAGVDVELPDPAEGPSGAVPLPDTGLHLEPDRTPWSDIAGHNDYPREPALKAWVANVKQELSLLGPPAPPLPTPAPPVPAGPELGSPAVPGGGT